MYKLQNKRLRKRSSGRTARESDVELLLANEQVDQIADYARRGRVYEQLSDVRLAERWIHAFKLFADSPSDEGRRTIETDLKAEIYLRGIEPPYDQVRSEVDRVVERISYGFETMTKEDPDAADKMNEDLEQDIADLKARIRQSN